MEILPFTFLLLVDSAIDVPKQKSAQKNNQWKEGHQRDLNVKHYFVVNTLEYAFGANNSGVELQNWNLGPQKYFCKIWGWKITNLWEHHYHLHMRDHNFKNGQSVVACFFEISYELVLNPVNYSDAYGEWQRPDKNLPPDLKTLKADKSVNSLVVACFALATKGSVVTCSTNPDQVRLAAS